MNEVEVKEMETNNLNPVPGKIKSHILGHQPESHLFQFAIGPGSSSLVNNFA